MPIEKASVRDAVIGGLVTALGTAIFALLTGAWGGKETVVDHRTDIILIRAEVTRIRDAVCLDHQHAPQCQTPGEVPK